MKASDLSTQLFLVFCVFKYRVFRKKCVFSQFTATPPSPSSLKETLKALNAMRIYSHSYWLAINCTAEYRQGGGG